ncbi:hypothetical protein mflW37_1630 [Mesoplasma florum W37]|uniref:Prolipoprotein n=2 Tax=Mesoplasma florum TaxID=2151 RepID=A0AAD2JDN6_MESFO|nr:hypothetical protein mflW37_1630 [Mesoplasma florum W37]AVN65568.1 Prolipoprotein [Mesoplasma florum]
MVGMKKLISLIGAASLATTPAMAVVSCKYIDTIQKSIDNKLAEVISSTSNYFKGAILANSEDYNGQSVDKYISKLKVGDLTSNSKDTTSMAKIFDTFLDTKQSSEYMKNEVYSKEEFDRPSTGNGASELISTIQKAYNEIYKLIGVNFDPTLWNTALPLLLDSLKADNISSIQKVMPKISSSLQIMKDVKVPNYSELIKLGVETNLDLKIYFSNELTSFVANLFSVEIEKPFVISENKDNINEKYYAHNSSVWKLIIKKMNSKDAEKPEINFTSQSLALLMNALFGINWYIQNFTADEYNLHSDEMLDDNHIFSTDKTNLEVIHEVNSSKIDKEIINSTNVDGLMQFIYDLFSGEKDKESFKLLRTFKILFQVDDDITVKNQKLDFNTKIIKFGSKTLDFKIGEWGSNGKTENGALNTFLSSSLDGLVKGYTASFDPDGGIMDFLNSIGMGSEQIGGVVSGLISSILTGIDMDHFFETFIKQIDDSLKNLLEWSFIKNKPLAEQITSIQTSVNTKVKPIIDSLLNSEAPFTNKFLGYLINTDIRKLMEIFGLENSLPVQLPKISLKQIIDIQLTKTLKLSDLLRLGAKGTSYLIALLGKGIAPKIVNIADAFNDTSLFLDPEFKIVNSQSTVQTLGEIKISPELIFKNEEGKEYTYILALATALSSRDNTGISITIPGGNKFGLKTTRTFTNKDGLKWIMGLGVELDNGVIDYNQFRPGTILYSIGTLWNDETGNLITGIMSGINDILKTIADIFDNKQNQSYLEDLNYIHYKTKMISYENFRDSKKDSHVTYEINYKNGIVNNTYVVKLLLPSSDQEEVNVKYQIEAFYKK